MDGVLSQEEISALLNNPDQHGNSGNNIVFPCKS